MSKAIVFDLDNTLYDELDYVLSGFWAVALYMNEKFEISAMDAFQLIDRIFIENGRGHIFDLALDELGICHDNHVEEMVNVYTNHEPEIVLRDGVKLALEHLRDSGYKLGIITNGRSEIQRKKVRALGVRSYVDYIVYADDFGKEYWKPHSRSYIFMTFKLNVDLGDMTYVGDDPGVDFDAPKSLGMRTVQIAFQDNERSELADKYIYDIRDLQYII